MQGGWPDFRALEFNIRFNNPGASQSSSSSSWKVPADGSNSVSASSSAQSDVTLSISSSNSSSPIVPGKVALGNGMAAVLHAAGAFLRLLSHGDDGPKRKNKKNVRKPKDLKIISPGAARFFAISTDPSLLLSRISSVLKGGWSKLKSHDAAVPSMLAIVLPSP